MKQSWKNILTAAVMGFVLPSVLFHIAGKQLASPTKPEPPPATTAPAPEDRLTMSFWQDGKIREMDMEEYLTGVVLAEMPASFETEALKAQSVVARTYTLKVMATGAKHGGAVCGDSACCQAYIDPADYTGGEANREKVRSAVLSTAGQVLTYEGNLIEATYFSCSGGSTEDAVAVWGTDYPYLRATDSPGEEGSAHYTDTVTFTAAEFAEKLGISKVTLGTATYTAGGGIHTISIGGKEFKGTEVRTLLSLRSTAFTISVQGETVTITTKGFGHRVGMSQYGADAMALEGKRYDEILAHYYQGTALIHFHN